MSNLTAHHTTQALVDQFASFTANVEALLPRQPWIQADKQLYPASKSFVIHRKLFTSATSYIAHFASEQLANLP